MSQRKPRPIRRFAMLALAVVLGGGCHTLDKNPPRDYRTIQASPDRDTARAEKLHAKALKVLHHCDKCYQCECVAKALCDPCKAEKQLQEALIADVRYGPAHNTLGTLYLRQRKLYLAAWEFEYAVQLMPERPEPLNNLGLVYEEAGRLGRAIGYFEQAYEVDPTNPEHIGNLARASLKQGTPLEEVRYLLSELRLHETRPDWVAWAEDLMETNPDPADGQIVLTTLGEEIIEEIEVGEEVGAESLPVPQPLLDEAPPELVQPLGVGPFGAPAPVEGR